MILTKPNRIRNLEIDLRQVVVKVVVLPSIVASAVPGDKLSFHVAVAVNVVDVDVDDVAVGYVVDADEAVVDVKKDDVVDVSVVGYVSSASVPVYMFAVTTPAYVAAWYGSVSLADVDHEHVDVEAAA